MLLILHDTESLSKMFTDNMYFLLKYVVMLWTACVKVVWLNAENV